MQQRKSVYIAEQNVETKFIYWELVECMIVLKVPLVR